MLNRLRFPRFLSMNLPLYPHKSAEDVMKEKSTEANIYNALLQIMEAGLTKGSDELTDLVKSGYLIRTEVSAEDQQGKH